MANFFSIQLSLTKVKKSITPFCSIISCSPFTMATASCSSSYSIVRGTAVYVKDVTFGHNGIVDGNERQIIKANGKLEEFCKICNKDEDLKFVPEISACGKLMTNMALIRTRCFAYSSFGWWVV